jgi:hypothetical protein
MKIFISWSGELSQSVALILRQWLQNVIQVVDPYVSSEDIEKGSRWFSDIDKKLEESDFGIVCMTRENMNKPWILFEAGAISRSISRSRVTPLLIDFSPADLGGPLAQFQATTLSENEMLRLVKDIGTYLGDSRFNDALIERAFHKWWPDLQQSMTQLIESVGRSDSRINVRPDRDILEEVLQTTRTLAQLIPTILPRVESQKVRKSVDSDMQKIQTELEKRRKMLLMVALEGAGHTAIEEGELYLEYTPDTQHLGALVAKSDNLKILRDVCKKVLGQELAIRMVVKDEASPSEKERLIDLAKKDPVVQEMLRTFRGELVDVRKVSEDRATESEEQVARQAAARRRD